MTTDSLMLIATALSSDNVETNRARAEVGPDRKAEDGSHFGIGGVKSLHAVDHRSLLLSERAGLGLGSAAHFLVGWASIWFSRIERSSHFRSFTGQRRDEFCIVSQIPYRTS